MMKEFAELLKERNVKELSELSGVATRPIFYAKSRKSNMTINNIEALLDAMGYQLKIIKRRKWNDEWKPSARTNWGYDAKN